VKPHALSLSAQAMPHWKGARGRGRLGLVLYTLGVGVEAPSAA